MQNKIPRIAGSAKEALKVMGVLWIIAVGSLFFGLKHIIDGPSFGWWVPTSFFWKRDGMIYLALACFGAGIIYLIIAIVRAVKNKR